MRLTLSSIRSAWLRLCLALPAFILSVSVAEVRADQLAIIAKKDCQRALQRLPSGTRLISFCSECPPERMELWRVERSVMLNAGASDGEVGVFVQRLRMSSRYYSRENPPGNKPVVLTPFKDEGFGHPREWAFETIDLAYVYVETKPGHWECLGKLLGLRCDVTTPALTVAP